MFFIRLREKRPKKESSEKRESYRCGRAACKYWERCHIGEGFTYLRWAKNYDWYKNQWKRTKRKDLPNPESHSKVEWAISG